ncbi:hypothetical protein [Paenibacillus sp. ATY16]|uniref:hypothetical protein n=1 Tax=Paenibacillus sp. ATY16 TaxID=1759312 RepID=UPI00200EA902|nr:hypothetical protein [Paenibacillus sp. ATY16]MCK9860719.1 hypothetical protein [Paenibacillus sp. ATY16]
MSRETPLITKRKIVLLALLLAVFYLAFKPSGLWFLTTEGMAAIANNTEDYTDQNGYVLPEAYKISIDLSDLDSNIGKELYDDGTYKIYVSSLDNTGSARSGGYRIGFRSKGTYSHHGASLVSGVWHKTVDEHSFTTIMSAKMAAAYNNKNYTSSQFAISGLNYKDGDDFGFYIFPSEAYGKDISFQETGTVELTVTGLYRNSWSKKS